MIARLGAVIKGTHRQCIEFTWHGGPMDAVEGALDSIADRFEASHVSGGTFLIDQPIRDLEYSVYSRAVAAEMIVEAEKVLGDLLLSANYYWEPGSYTLFLIYHRDWGELRKHWCDWITGYYRRERRKYDTANDST